MYTFAKKTDSELEKDVMTELNFDPRITSTDIQVTAKEGVITLRGTVPHYSERIFSEKTAQRVGGVRVIADELGVDLFGDGERTDEQIAIAALGTLQWNCQVPESVKIVVQRGWLTLSGEVEWDYQRIAAHDCLFKLLGVSGMTNNITLKPCTVAIDIKSRIEEALSRKAENMRQFVSVDVDGSRVTLSGCVKTLAQINEARIAAYSAPGVTYVLNNLTLSR